MVVALNGDAMFGCLVLYQYFCQWGFIYVLFLSEIHIAVIYQFRHWKCIIRCIYLYSIFHSGNTGLRVLWLILTKCLYCESKTTKPWRLTANKHIHTSSFLIHTTFWIYNFTLLSICHHRLTTPYLRFYSLSSTTSLIFWLCASFLKDRFTHLKTIFRCPYEHWTCFFFL